MNISFLRVWLVIGVLVAVVVLRRRWNRWGFHWTNLVVAAFFIPFWPVLAWGEIWNTKSYNLRKKRKG